MRHSYYFEKNLKTLEFLLPKNCKVLVNGEQGGFISRKLKHVRPDLTVDTPDRKMSGKYDYIFLYGQLGKSENIMQLLCETKKLAKPTSRVIIYQHNHLWQGILTLLEQLGAKRKEGIFNWLSVGDVKSYTSASGIEVTRIYRRTLIPVELFGLGKLVNKLAVILPFFDFLKLDQYLVCRVIMPETKSMGLTICITVRNEKENIEPIVKSLPILTENQEILFVEGNSTDGTREEIRRVLRKYPRKSVRVIGQPGKGQGDAIRVGFKHAAYNAVVLYEGDGTSDPDDIRFYFDALRSGQAEFIEGSRFVYPREREAMPFVKQVGNIFFAVWFSFFLGQRTTDVLSGIKAIRKDLYLRIYDNWGYLGVSDPFGDFELLFGAARWGLKFGEIPMRYYPRQYGRPKTNVLTHGPVLLKMAVIGHWVFRGN